MQNGVPDENGELIGQLSEATRGLYLRNCRAVWNECVSLGYLTNQEYPFSNVKKKKLVAIPVGDTRKDRYLNAEQITELYWVFVEKCYPKSWKKGYAENAHYSLGLFLAQYLCNGFNMADAAELKYTQFYFDSDRKAFKFKRVKTINRSEGCGEVIIPIIEPLQKILDEIAAEPVLNGFVFPDILQGATHKAIKRKRISGELKCARPRHQNLSGCIKLGGSPIGNMVQAFLRNKSNPCPSRGQVYLTEYGTFDRQDHYRKIHCPISDRNDVRVQWQTFRLGAQSDRGGCEEHG